MTASSFVTTAAASRSLIVSVLLTVLLAGLAGPALGQAANEHNPEALARAKAIQEGRGEFEMVLIHGLGGSAKVWDEVLPFLKNTFKVRVFEMSGHGSTQPEGDASITREVARLAAFIDEVGFAYPTLVGHGMGGMIALQYTLDHPADVHRLIVMDSAPLQLASPEEKAAVGHLLATDYDRFVASRYLSMSPSENVTDTILEMALRTDSASFISLLMSSFDFDLTDRLETLSVPLLVVGSEMMFPAEDSSRHLLAHYGFANARSLSFKRMGKIGHYMMLEQPIMTSSVLLAFGVTAGYTFEN